MCFVAQNGYGALAGIDTGHVGGIERQTALMARWFASHGYEVSMIVWDEGQPDGVQIAGVRIFTTCRKDAGMKGIRFFIPKWTSLCQAMKRADADIYYYNCGDLGLGQVALWCQKHGRKCVFSVASDSICSPELSVLKPQRERILYRYGLKHSTAVVVQTRRQQHLLHEGFGIQSAMIPMPSEGCDADAHIPPQNLPGRDAHVLWVGRISREKRLEWLLDIAEQCPEIIFDVVGAANTDSDYALRMAERASHIPNVKMQGRIAHSEIAKYYQRCRVLCCTSAYEGFPNTFLEAWSCGTPVVSTFDPDDIIARHGLGWTASSRDELVIALRDSVCESAQWQAASAAAREYYQTNHTLDVCMSRFARFMNDLEARRSTCIREQN
jgi:glycosyltransferase involved in cell wall biosynthesis